MTILGDTAVLESHATEGFVHQFEAFLNLLDIVAFALVTTELYGIDRLEQLRQRIIAVKFGEFAPLELFKDQKTGELIPLYVWFRVVFALMAVTAGFWLAAQLLGMAIDLIRDRPVQLPPWKEVKFLFFLFGLVGGMLLLMYAAWFARAALVPGLIYMTKFFKIQGMMVVAGSVIYLFARALAIIYDLRGP